MRRRNDDGLAGVNPERIKVFHVADSDAIVGGITDNFVLDLLPTLHGLFDKNLRRESQRLCTESS